MYQPLTKEEEAELEGEEAQLAQAQSVAIAIEIVGEMQLTAEELEAGMRALSTGFGAVYKEGSELSCESSVRERVREVVQQLKDRSLQEVELLPFPSVRAAQSAVDSRNARYGRRSPSESLDGDALDGEAGAKPGSLSPLTKLGAAEKAAEKFVAQRLQPAVQKVRKSSPKDWVGNLRAGATYAGELWDRLNGGGAGSKAKRLPEGLAMPEPTKEERAAVISALSLEVNGLEKRLQDGSKAREAKLRKADISMRARMASELRKLDDEVSSLSRALAVRTLQLEMEYIYGSLEEEALDNCVGKPEGLIMVGRGSDDELALLAAEFRLLDEALAALVQLVDRGSAIVINEDELVALATDVPDLRSRLGIADNEVFGGSGMSFLKIQLQLKEAVLKVQEGVEFGSRGVRLLGSDIVNASQLFWRAASGDTLKAREVQALRRTVRDILTFVPFTVILIAPLTPVGHVLVFGFIQRYFPGFFPSQFSNRRQEIMTRYESLQQQLTAAQERAIEEAEERELRQATAAVARLTAPRMAAASAGASSAAANAPVAGSSGAMQAAGEVAGANSDAEVQVQLLKQAVQQAGEEAMLTDESEEGASGQGHGSSQRTKGSR